MEFGHKEQCPNSFASGFKVILNLKMKSRWFFIFFFCGQKSVRNTYSNQNYLTKKKFFFGLCNFCRDRPDFANELFMVKLPRNFSPKK